MFPDAGVSAGTDSALSGSRDAGSLTFSERTGVMRRYSTKGLEWVKTWDPKIESGNIGTDLRNGAPELKQDGFCIESMDESALYAVSLGNADPNRRYNSIS